MNNRARNSSSNMLILLGKNLSVIDRMLHYFIVYILMPKHSNCSKISDTEMQIICTVKNRLKVNQAYVMMNHMLH